MKLPERVFDKKSQNKWVEDGKPLGITVSLMAQTSKADPGRRMKIVGVSVIGIKIPKQRKKAINIKVNKDKTKKYGNTL